MKRLWIGLLVLTLLLTGGLVLRHQMEKIHSQISQDLQSASQAALEEDWPQAQALAQNAESLWQKCHHLTAAFADHTPMDEIDGLFTELDVFSREHEMPHFSAICAHLAKLTDSMAESHNVSWWNFL